MSITGKIHSIQSMGTLDGPGVRFVVFLQGCNLRCGCCHNPDTWDMTDGTEYTAEEIVKRAVRFKEYFGDKGGITLSGGEPLLQADFAREIFELCHQQGINTCLDTSGSIMNDKVRALLEETDRVLLDIKYTDNEKYLSYVGCDMQKPLDFLSYLNEKNIPVTLRQVIIPVINGDDANAEKLRGLAEKYPTVDKTELLPFKKICQVKYDKMGIEFPFASYDTPDRELMQRLNKIISKE